MYDKACDKAPHQCAIDAAASFDLSSKAIKWIGSFLTGRTQQVRIGGALSITSNVISGIIQGSLLRPIFYIMLTKSLLSSMLLPIEGFADDLKFVADLSPHTKAEVGLQSKINKVAIRAESHRMPLSKEKNVVLHCGKKQPNRVYTLYDEVIVSVDNVADLGIVRTASAMYSDQCHSLASKAAKTVNAIRRIFRIPEQENSYGLLSSTTYQYLLPIINYCSPVWSPILISDITTIERAQRRYTKRGRRLETMCYANRL